jgi:hypothetical protein
MIDRNKLYHVFGRLRWGTETNRVITFEDLHTPGASLPAHTTNAPLITIWSVEEQDRYPNEGEYAQFIDEFRCR